MQKLENVMPKTAQDLVSASNGRPERKIFYGTLSLEMHTFMQNTADALEFIGETISERIYM